MPALVVEILSPATRHRDETLKRSLYGRAGVREYWLVDVERDRILVCRLGSDGDLVTVADVSAASGGVLTSPLLPGFHVPVARLFARPGA